MNNQRIRTFNKISLQKWNRLYYEKHEDFQFLSQNIFPWLFTFSPSSDENLDPLTNDRKYTYKKFFNFFLKFLVFILFQIIRTDKIKAEKKASSAASVRNTSKNRIGFSFCHFNKENVGHRIFNSPVFPVIETFSNFVLNNNHSWLNWSLFLVILSKKSCWPR